MQHNNNTAKPRTCLHSVEQVVRSPDEREKVRRVHTLILLRRVQRSVTLLHSYIIAEGQEG